MVDRVERMYFAATPYCDDRSTDLSLEHAIVDHRYHTGAVDERFHFGGDVGEVGRRGEDDAISFVHESDVVVEAVSVVAAFHVFVFGALVAGAASAQRLSGERDKLCLDSLFFEFREDMLDEDRRVAVLARTAVECDYFYRCCFWHWENPFYDFKRKENYTISDWVGKGRIQDSPLRDWIFKLEGEYKISSYVHSKCNEK